MNRSLRFSIFLTVLALASCRALPTESLELSSSDQSGGQPSGPAPAPDPGRLQQSLEAAVGVAVDVYAQETVLDERAGARTFVAFVASGTDYCRGRLPAERAGECVFHGRPGGLPWESREFLGFAVLEGEAELQVRHFRVVNKVGVLSRGRAPHSEIPGTSWDPWPHPASAYANVAIEHFLVDDVDGDGHLELVVYSSYSDVAAEISGEGDEDEDDEDDFGDGEEDDDFEPLSAEDATRYPYDGERLTILREDLSLEFDVDLYHRLNELDPGGFYDNDILRVDYVIERERVVVHWCEISPMISALEAQCSLDVLCASPTHRVVVPYDRSADRYGERQSEALRPVVDTWDFDRCPPLEGQP